MGGGGDKGEQPTSSTGARSAWRTTTQSSSPRQVNNRDGAEGLINSTGKLIGPLAVRDRPHPAFLGWHREEVFKG